ncbi:MAG TPA: hypothetical protein VHM19_06555 [Polyangiales bacterium]|nr:hypothetical protein [Polyangiales bacterium]
MSILILCMSIAACMAWSANAFAQIATADQSSAPSPHTLAHEADARSLSRAHEEILVRASTLAEYALVRRRSLKRQVVGAHAEAIGRALQSAAKASTHLAGDARTHEEKDCIEAVRQDQTQAMDRFDKLAEELKQPAPDAEVIVRLAREIQLAINDAIEQGRKLFAPVPALR